MSLLKNSILITKRGFLINAIFFFNFFTLYFVISFHIPQKVIPSVDNRLVAQTLLQWTIATTLLLTSFFIHRIDKLRLIYVSSIAISITTVLLFCVSNEVLKIAIILAIGIFFSTAMLASFTYFWNLTVPEERGRVAGLIGSVSLPFYFIVDYLVAPALDFLGTAVLGIILSLGPIIIILLRPAKTVLTAKKAERGNYPEKRTVILYSIPWILFSLINSTLAKNISLNVLQQISSSSYLSLIILQGIGTIFGATCGGIIADFFGRRLSLAFSLTLYGISSALAGLTKVTEILTIVYVANGLSWGILLILYTFVVWGDLANKENCAKMYSIGLITLYLTIGVGFLPTPISQIPLVVSSLASCLLIFLSNMPLVLAPELLSSDFRERIKLKLYTNVIRKIRK
jgi:MFS family permease